ncbi:DMT family transporter [Polymorphum gilvum]|uniref:Putative permease protein n=1 Tax=Polymorphum gilvum (strain LMG 25793 / CGMCC 1.9160 / SL003B-26A1) TaxID=991905 RepID=F2J396_POLGS|nr:DMT family transporter [Polymorphum gilvum]ADZ69903.1 Putative permease protein [Polymorphum gilvum SL003B-26A1]
MALSGADSKATAGGSEHAAGADLTLPRPMLGIGLKLLSTLVFSVMIVALKIAAERVPIGEVVFARNFFGIFPVLIMVILRGEFIVAFRTRQPWGHVGRAVVGMTAMLASFTSYKFLPLPDATAIGFASPLFVVVLAFLFLGERVRVFRWSAVGVGFLGILIILSPHIGATAISGSTWFGALCAAAAAFFSALAMIFVRKLCETERTATIVTWFSGTASLLALLTIPFGWIDPTWAWVVPDWETAGLLVFVGLAGGLGQIIMTQSYRYADASTIAPFDYANMIWAVLLGWLLFSEVPVAEVIIGAAIVIAAGIFVIFRERRLGFDRTRDRRASTPSKV